MPCRREGRTTIVYRALLKPPDGSGCGSEVAAKAIKTSLSRDRDAFLQEVRAVVVYGTSLLVTRLPWTVILSHCTVALEHDLTHLFACSLGQAACLAQLQHKHIVNFLGMVYGQDPLSITELLPNGTVTTFLQMNRERLPPQRCNPNERCPPWLILSLTVFAAR